jgi:hypothetical protein
MKPPNMAEKVLILIENPKIHLKNVEKWRFVQITLPSSYPPFWKYRTLGDKNGTNSQEELLKDSIFANSAIH